MPSFGEVVEPCSRALFCDDSSEDEDHSKKSIRKWELHWFNKAEMLVPLSNVLVLQGRLALDFFENNVLKLKENKICEVKEVSSSKIKSMKRRQAKSMSIYKVSSENVACLCPDVEHDDCNIILDALMPILSKTKQVTLIMSAPAPLFKCSDPSLDLPPSFMRALYSATFKHENVIAPLLEHPNIVTGITAAVLSWCEVFKIPGCLYICYSDSEEVDSISAEPLVQIFSKLFGNILNLSNFTLKNVIRESTNNLYM